MRVWRQGVFDHTVRCYRYRPVPVGTGTGAGAGTGTGPVPVRYHLRLEPTVPTHRGPLSVKRCVVRLDR